MSLDLDPNEFLLVYSEFGVYVDYPTGKRSRPEELIWPATPRSSSYADPYLFLYLDKSIEIYDVQSAVWLQSMPIGKTRPLTSDGFISLSSDPNLGSQPSGKFLYLTQSTRETLNLDISSANSHNISISPPFNFSQQQSMNEEEGYEYLSSVIGPDDEQSSMHL